MQYAGICSRAVAILALAIGANAAFFTFYANYVLKPLPIRGADRHFELTGRNAEGRRTLDGAGTGGVA